MTTTNVIILSLVFFNIAITVAFCSYAMVLYQKTKRPMNDTTQACDTDDLLSLHKLANHVENDGRGNTIRDNFRTPISVPKPQEDAWHLYESMYFKPTPQSAKSGFTINREILQMLRNVLWETKSDATLTAYIENILTWHLRANEDLLNEAASACKRYKTLNL